MHAPFCTAVPPAGGGGGTTLSTSDSVLASEVCGSGGRCGIFSDTDANASAAPAAGTKSIPPSFNPPLVTPLTATATAFFRTFPLPAVTVPSAAPPPATPAPASAPIAAATPAAATPAAEPPALARPFESGVSAANPRASRHSLHLCLSVVRFDNQDPIETQHMLHVL